MSQENERVAIRAFARYIGVTDTYVKKQMFDPVKNPNGPIKESICKNQMNGRPMLFKELALTEWVAAGLTIKNPEVLALVVPLIKAPQDLPWGNATTNEGTPAPKTDAPGQTVNNPNIKEEKIPRPLTEAGNLVHEDMGAYEAKGLKEVFIAGKHELEYRKMLGQLVDKDEVYKMLFEFGQEIRNSFMQMPARIISQVLACDNEREGREVMLREIENTLLILSRGPKEKQQEEDGEGESEAANI